MFPKTFSSLYIAFFSPTDPRSPLLIEVTSDSKILPSLISNLVPVVCSRISCPKAPNLLVLGSIKVIGLLLKTLRWIV